MVRSHLLLIDAIINLALGVVLVVIPKAMANAVGLPPVENAFYASILGAVLFGIGVALGIEWNRRNGGLVGLGLAGAIAINVSGGVCLTGWLIFGSLGIPARGQVMLWILAVVLFAISAAEWMSHREPKQLEKGPP